MLVDCYPNHNHNIKLHERHTSSSSNQSPNPVPFSPFGSAPSPIPTHPPPPTPPILTLHTQTSSPARRPIPPHTPCSPSKHNAQTSHTSTSVLKPTLPTQLPLPSSNPLISVPNPPLYSLPPSMLLSIALTPDQPCPYLYGSFSTSLNLYISISIISSLSISMHLSIHPHPHLHIPISIFHFRSRSLHLYSFLQLHLHISTISSPQQYHNSIILPSIPPGRPRRYDPLHIPISMSRPLYLHLCFTTSPSPFILAPGGSPKPTKIPQPSPPRVVQHHRLIQQRQNEGAG